jgi:L-ribulose-5-phosphate 4-epimerase
MLENLKENVLNANLDLVSYGLVLFTWGNVSAKDDETGHIVIKPSGISYDNMKADDMVVVDMDGNVIEGNYNPSSDTATHIEIYKANSGIKGVVHTHSTWATIWAQAGRDIPFLGTTHGDYFYGDIPCTRKMNEGEIKADYEKNTGVVIVETFNEKKVNFMQVPSVIVNNHGPFSWGEDAFDAVHNAVVLEQIAKTAYYAKDINADVKMDQVLLDKHYLRKHGENAYYGQTGENK